MNQQALNTPSNTQQFSALDAAISQHNAINELEKFGEYLKQTALNHVELRVFFASLWAFFREVPTGILALSLRVSDDWMSKYDEWEGTSRAAPILYANVDEFGLQSDQKLLPTHHHLFIELAHVLGVQRQDLLASANILPAGRYFGQLTRDYYRQKDIPAAIGFHLASEFTSSVEFQFFLDGFKAHQEAYQLIGEKQSALTFFKIHTMVEPLHLELGKLSARNYLEKNPEAITEIEVGAMAFMEGFEKLFSSLNHHLFERKTEAYAA